jgi:hypothetical protein
LTSGTFVADDPDLGLVAYGGILSSEGSSVVVEPRDAVRKRVFIGPLSVLVSIDAGAIGQFSYNAGAGSVSVTVEQQSGAPVASQVAIWVESTAGDSWTASADSANIQSGRGGWVVSLGGDGATFELSRS